VPALRWTVSQVGARQHYGIPRGFERVGTLRALYTDAWCRWGRPLLGMGPMTARALAARHHPEVPGRKVISFTPSSVYHSLRAQSARGVADSYREYLRVGRWFATRVNADLERRQLVPGHDAFFGFNSASLETIQLMRSRDILTVLDQIDPGRFEEERVMEERRKWPGWQRDTERIPPEYFDRISREWALCDIVVVNSDWSKSALRTQGVPGSKIVVAPIAYETPPASAGQDPGVRGASATLTVLWLGTVNLRKGIQYLIDSARTLAGEDIRFLVAGPIEISDEAKASAPPNVSFLGRVNRSEAGDLYRRADLFVLPTISDGFAITQLEAMGHGLPVITTPNCGQVVTDAVDGFIVAAGDSAPLSAAILSLHRDRRQLRRMSAAARANVARFELPRQTKYLESAIRDWVHHVLPSNFADRVQ
jgi:glycosyltransferase involved in cell wall biosynthesis